MAFTKEEQALIRAGAATIVKMPDGRVVLEKKGRGAGVRDGRVQEDRARSSQGGEGWVYMMRCIGSNRCKLGRSVDVEARLKRVNGHGNSIAPYEVEVCWKRRVPNDKEAEEVLHGLFPERRVRGEWFDLTDSEIDDILNLSSADLQELIRVNADY